MVKWIRMVRWSDPEGSGLTEKSMIRPRKTQMSDLPCGDMKAKLPIGSLGARARPLSIESFISGESKQCLAASIREKAHRRAVSG